MEQGVLEERFAALLVVPVAELVENVWLLKRS